MTVQEQSPPTATAAHPSLRDLTRRWFLYLSTFRLLESKPGAEEVVNQLLALLTDMRNRAASEPSLQVKYRQVEPPLVYLADEVLLNSGWQDELVWGGALLESREFKTRHGGKDFFARLSVAMTHGEREVLEVFFRCLAMGYRGMHLSQPLQLTVLRQQLLALLAPEPLQDRICPAAYKGIDASPFVKFPSVRWARAILGLVFALCLIYLGALVNVYSKSKGVNDAVEAINTEVEKALPVTPSTGAEVSGQDGKAGGG